MRPVFPFFLSILQKLVFHNILVCFRKSPDTLICDESGCREFFPVITFPEFLCQRHNLYAERKLFRVQPVVFRKRGTATRNYASFQSAPPGYTPKLLKENIRSPEAECNLHAYDGCATYKAHGWKPVIYPDMDVMAVLPMWLMHFSLFGLRISDSLFSFGDGQILLTQCTCFHGLCNKCKVLG